MKMFLQTCFQVGLPLINVALCLSPSPAPRVTPTWLHCARHLRALECCLGAGAQQPQLFIKRTDVCEGSRHPLVHTPGGAGLFIMSGLNKGHIVLLHSLLQCVSSRNPLFQFSALYCVHRKQPHEFNQSNPAPVSPLRRRAKVQKDTVWL